MQREDPPLRSRDGDIENPADFARAILRALGLQDMPLVLALEFSLPGSDCVPTLKITRALTKGETRLLADAIEVRRFKLWPDGEPQRSDFPSCDRAATAEGDLVTVHPLDRRTPLTLPLAEQAPISASAPGLDSRPTPASHRPGE